MKKAVFETTKKKEVGVSDLTLISKISNEAINDNLKKRFENREIYVRHPYLSGPLTLFEPIARGGNIANLVQRHTLAMCLFPLTLFGIVCS